MACGRGGNKGFTFDIASIGVIYPNQALGATLAMQMPDSPGHKSDAYQEG